MSTGYSWEGMAGACDAAWCAPCTWAPLWWPCLLVLDLYLYLYWYFWAFHRSGSTIRIQ